MDRSKHCISPHHQLCARLGSDAAPIVADLGREAADPASGDSEEKLAELGCASAPGFLINGHYVGTFMAAINWPAVRGAYDGVRL